MQKNGTGSENFLYVGVVKLFIFFFFTELPCLSRNSNSTKTVFQCTKEEVLTLIFQEVSLWTASGNGYVTSLYEIDAVPAYISSITAA